MDRYIVVSGTGPMSKPRFYVVSPSKDQCDGRYIGNLFVAGRIDEEFESLHQAMDFIREF